MKISLFFILLFAAPMTFAQNICSEPNLPQLVNQGQNAFNNTALTQAIQKSSVTVIGEMHFLTALKPRLDLIQKFSELGSGKKCVAYEFAKKEGKNFNDFISRISQMMTEIQDPIFREKNPQITDEMIRKYVAAFKQLYDYYAPMAELTSKLGMKAIMVDHKEHTFEVEKTIDERNFAMAENLKAALQNDCDSILFFVGKAHLGFNSDSTTRVQDLIRSLSISFTTIHLQMTQENMVYQLKSWDLCGADRNPTLIDYAFFSNASLSGDPLILPLVSGVKWKDYDFTLLAP